MEIYEDAIATFRSGATGRAEDFAAFSIVQSRQTAREDCRDRELPTPWLSRSTVMPASD
jgi:hypothetical protein